MREHHIPVTRTARYHTLGPERGAAELWLLCHGYGQLASRFLARFAALDDGTRLLVAPEALSRFYLDAVSGTPAAERRVGATWMTREDREAEIADQVVYLDAVLAATRAPLAGDGDAAVVALGFSQGVATVSRWAVASETRLARLVLWGGRLPPDLELPALRERLAGAPVILVSGATDVFVPPEKLAEERARLEGAGIAASVLSFTGGHEIEAQPLAALAATSVSAPRA